MADDMIGNIAKIIPIVAAGLSGDPETVDRTMRAGQQARAMRYQQEDRERQEQYNQALENFGNEIFGMGELPNETQIATAAAKHRIKLQDVNKTIGNFMQFRQMKQGMDISGRQMGLREQQFATGQEWKGKEFAERQRQAGIEEALAKQRMAGQESRFQRGLESQAELQERRLSAQRGMQGQRLAAAEQAALRKAEGAGLPGAGVSEKPMSQKEIQTATRQHYDLLLQELTNQYNLGVIGPDEYAAMQQKVMNDFQNDSKIVGEGQKPAWMGGTSVTKKDEEFLNKIREALR